MAIGNGAGEFTQGTGSVAIGYDCGQTGQGTGSVAIGSNAGQSAQGSSSIAIGAYAGNVNQPNNSIVLNASGAAFITQPASSDAFYVNPIRVETTYLVGPTGVMVWNSSTKEVTYQVKNFIIEHPLNPNKYLVHACLEGPEAGVYYRGTSEIKGTEQIIELPDYVSFATEFTVNVTPIYNGKIRNLNCSKIENNKFTVYGEAGEFYWTVIGKRLNINVEPDRDSVVVKGDGPYTYLG